jgi:hypothetical protein
MITFDRSALMTWAWTLPTRATGALNLPMSNFGLSVEA